MSISCVICGEWYPSAGRDRLDICEPCYTANFAGASPPLDLHAPMAREALEAYVDSAHQLTPRQVQASWATPLVVRDGKRAELIASGNEFVIGYDPATGKELWRTKGLESNTIATPLIGHGLVIVSAGYPTKTDAWPLSSIPPATTWPR